jgi:hypothetical protein
MSCKMLFSVPLIGSTVRGIARYGCCLAAQSFGYDRADCGANCASQSDCQPGFTGM